MNDPTVELFNAGKRVLAYPKHTKSLRLFSYIPYIPAIALQMANQMQTGMEKWRIDDRPKDSISRTETVGDLFVGK